MDYFLYSDENKKKTLIALLVYLNKSDNRNHSNELKFIEEVAGHMGLGEEDVYDIRQGKQDFEFTLPKMEDERMMFFMHVIHLMRIDNVIAPEEEHVAHEIGLRLGISSMLVSDLIRDYRHEIATGQKISASHVEGTIKKYLN